ncbi:hypothetical protein [Brevibacillus laterosporus]|uniref:hypothetical protein n=1 Tax=Brevibacillus laterosporus TaxID=1465 RepID=UPI002655B5EB|nr:hypothetical protein [Brevibacillus laterosporus]MDN9010981.1 hypothetical protein [Brevibacillus laterosporus]MDO0942004.1 hypothetical protein [Brevibacillus laterosporus]
MYIGVFDMQERLDQTRKMLRDKKHLLKMLEEDIRGLENDVQVLEEMLTTCPSDTAK